jgi:hypothetical protein
MMKKRVMISLSKTFPKTHKRAGVKTFFQRSIKNGQKIHTIRTGYERWRHNIDKVINGTHIVSLRQWTGVPYHSPQDEIGLYEKDVGYERISMAYDPDTKKVRAVINGKPYNDVKKLAENDGLKWDDFVDFFFGKGAHNATLFQGIIIHFTKFRYNSTDI